MDTLNFKDYSQKLLLSKHGNLNITTGEIMVSISLNRVQNMGNF